MLTSRQVLTLCIFKIALRDSAKKWKYVLEELEVNIEIEGLDAEHMKEDPENWRNESVKLAVTGESAVGKSSFINTILNLKSGDPGFAALSSIGNTTTKPTIYEYPGNPKITLHDLPGFGTIELPTNEYEKKNGIP